MSNDPRDPPIDLRIAGDLRTRIEAGEFDSDGKIPSVRTLMHEHEVAYDTAQHAVRTPGSRGLGSPLPQPRVLRHRA